MTTIARIRDLSLQGLAVIGSLAILTLMLHVTTDVVLRNTINQPVPATYEIVTNYYMIALAFIPLAWVEKSGGMVNVEAVEPFLSPRLLWLSDRLVAVLSTLIYLALAWVTFEASLKTWEAGTFVLAQNIPIPTWPASFLPPLGFALAASVTAARIVAPFGETQEDWTVTHYTSEPEE